MYGLVLALALHAAVVLPMFLDIPEPLGGGGTDLDAISVEVTVVAASARESRDTAEAAAPTSAASVEMVEGADTAAAAATGEASVDAQPGAADHDHAAPTGELLSPEHLRLPSREPVTEPAVQSASTPPRSEALQIEPDHDPVTPQTQAAPRPEPSQSPPHPDPEPEPKPAPAASDPAPTAASAAQSGGAAARAAAASDTTRAAAVPTPGAIRAFARSVAEALARSRPKALTVQARGTVRVAFAVADGGGLDFVRVARSSGHTVLDDTAIGAVRRTSFPVPPAGLDLVQRTYEVPYHFR